MAATGLSKKMFENMQTSSPSVPSPMRIIEQEREPEIPLTKEEKLELMEAKRKQKEEEQADAKFGKSGGTALKGIDPSDPGLNSAGINDFNSFFGKFRGS